MKIITRAVIDWATCTVLEEDSYEYSGPIVQAKDSGSPPQAVDPYAQAAAQYGLSTGTGGIQCGSESHQPSQPHGFLYLERKLSKWWIYRSFGFGTRRADSLYGRNAV
jgi:hypothetical protein